MYKCFCSHANENQSFIEGSVLGLMEAVGFEPWYSPISIESATQWKDAISRGLQESEWFILFMSPASASSKWVKIETKWAMKNRRGRIVPILIEDCDPNDFHPKLHLINFIDFRTDRKKGERKLVKLLVDTKYNPIRRASGIEGIWTGDVSEGKGPLFPNGVEYSVKASLNVIGSEVKGKFSIDIPIEKSLVHFEFNATGDFFYEKFLQLNYMSKDSGSIQFGSIIAELSAEGINMTGRFIGYSPQQETIVNGSITLTKSA